MLILFSLTVFFFSYNIDNSIRLMGFDPEAAHGVVSSTLGLGNSKLIGTDGRKLAGWRDTLETDIFGSWGWDEGHVAGDGAERSQPKGTGKYGAIWAGQKETGGVSNKFLGEMTANDGFWRWRDDIPKSRVLRHAAGASPAAIWFSSTSSPVLFQVTLFSTMSLYLMGPCISSQTIHILYLQCHPLLQPLVQA